MEKFALLHKFNHWSEVLSVLSYCDGSDVEFLCHKRGETYKDPLGKEYVTYSKSHFSKETPVILNGSVHLETFPLSQGKIPYSALPYKLAIEHTTGYSPWDFLQMVDLARISTGRYYENDQEDSQGSKVIYLMNRKCYDRFMNVDWKSFGKDYYESYKYLIEKLINEGYIKPTYIEPAQFWLENVKHSEGLVESDNLCICINWCNMNKKSRVIKIVEICNKLHEVEGKEIDIRLHSYTSSSFLKYLEELPFVNLIKYEDMSKYDIMDKYLTYFVDGTGLGYEIAYRNKFNNRNVNIFYLSGLDSDLKEGGFEGIVEMGAVPVYDFRDYIDGQRESNFTSDVIKESFPHGNNVPLECYNIFEEAKNNFKYLN